MKLTNTQLRLLAAASQCDDRALERPSNLTGGAAGKVVAILQITDVVRGDHHHEVAAAMVWGAIEH